LVSQRVFPIAHDLSAARAANSRRFDYAQVPEIFFMCFTPR
jgi:hypothetical protein